MRFLILWLFELLQNVEYREKLREILIDTYHLRNTVEGYDFPLVLDESGTVVKKCDKSAVAVVIPQGVTTIGMDAFDGCTSLTSIEIPDSVITIEEGAFFGCASLMSIKIPESVTAMGDWPFSGCISLTSIQIPDSVTTIGDYAFKVMYL